MANSSDEILEDMESTLSSDGVGLSTMVSGISAAAQTKKSTLSSSEERELRRVYDRLSDYHVRSGINNEIKDLQAWQNAARLKLKSNIQNNILTDQNQIESSHSATQNRIDELKQKLSDLESNPMKTISVTDISEMFKYLNKKLTKKDFEEMMWEVDEVTPSKIFRNLLTGDFAKHQIFCLQ